MSWFRGGAAVLWIAGIAGMVIGSVNGNNNGWVVSAGCLTLVGSASLFVATAATRRDRVDVFEEADAEGWLRVNNRAFPDHAEQGDWDAERFAARRAEAWFDDAFARGTTYGARFRAMADRELSFVTIWGSHGDGTQLAIRPIYAQQKCCYIIH